MRWLVPSPVVLPLLVAAGLVAAAPICRRRIADTLAILTASLVTIACGFLMRISAEHTVVYWFGDWVPRGTTALGISFTIDPLGAGTATFAGFLVTVALIYCWQYFDAVRTYFHALMLIFLAALAGFCLTGDLFNLFVFFELMSVVAYALAGYKVEETQALAGSINFAVTNSVGGFLVLIGIGLLYGRTGALNMAQVGLSLGHQPPDRLVIIALTLLLSGFFIKAAVVPFHFWLADAHAVAPAPVCVLFSGVMIELGLYGSFRVYWTVFHPGLAAAEERMRWVLLVAGALTAVLGAILCFEQTHLKRLLAFSSISHIGMILAGAACLTAQGLAGAALYVLGHGCVKGALFLCAGILLHRLGSVEQEELFGRGKRLRLVGAAFALSGLGLAGFPPFGTYLGKQMMEEAGYSIGQEWLPWVFLFSSAVTAGAVLRVGGMVFLGWGGVPSREKGKQPAEKDQPETRSSHGKTPWAMMAAPVLLALVPLATALCGTALAKGMDAAAERFTNQPGYVSAVIGGKATEPAQSPSPVQPTGRGLAFGFAGAAGAVLIALAALFKKRFPERARRAVSLLWSAVAKALGAIHTGHIGDLIVWLMIGVVVIGIALAASAARP